MTSKEQADILIREAARTWVYKGPIAFEKAVELEIPLTELLEVAKAAQATIQESDYAPLADSAWTSPEYKELLKALSALRATGKVKL